MRKENGKKCLLNKQCISGNCHDSKCKKPAEYRPCRLKKGSPTCPSGTKCDPVSLHCLPSNWSGLSKERCSRTAECPNGMYCDLKQKCKPKLKVGEGCLWRRQCGDGVICHDGVCKSKCFQKSDCTKGKVCEDFNGIGVCVDKKDVKVLERQSQHKSQGSAKKSKASKQLKWNIFNFSSTTSTVVLIILAIIVIFISYKLIRWILEGTIVNGYSERPLPFVPKINVEQPRINVEQPQPSAASPEVQRLIKKWDQMTMKPSDQGQDDEMVDIPLTPVERREFRTVLDPKRLGEFSKEEKDLRPHDATMETSQVWR